MSNEIKSQISFSNSFSYSTYVYIQPLACTLLMQLFVCIDCAQIEPKPKNIVNQNENEEIDEKAA